MAKIGLSDLSETQIKYKKHPADQNIVLKYEVVVSEIHKDKLDQQIKTNEDVKTSIQSEIDRLAKIPPENKDVLYERNKKSELERQNEILESEKKIKVELVEAKVWL